MKLIKIYNGRIITPTHIIPQGTVLVKAGKIKAVEPGTIEVADAEEIDAKDQYISPGFIDIHVHGGGGHDFMDGTEEAFLEIARTHAGYGTTALFPTTLTAEKEDLLLTLELFEQARQNNTQGAQLLGMHLEGPYFAQSQRGAQDPRYIRNPDPKEYKEIIAYSNSIKRWSAAPELPGSLAFGEYLTGKGILAAVAHTDAIYEEVEKAFAKGYSLATHLYSAMSGVTRRNAFRYAGVIEAAYLLDNMDVEIIADGVHLPSPLLKLVYKIKGADRIALITDAMRGAGMPEGASILGSKHNGLAVIIEDGVAKLPDRSSFAGSVATSDRLVRNMINMAEVSLVDTIKMASTTPARIMGISDKKGALIKGKDADIILFDENINVSMTMIKGRLVYQSKAVNEPT